MNKLFSPGSIITITGAALSVIGLIAYFTNATNLSVPTFFYGVPILLIGLSLKTVELPPAKRVIPENKLSNLREQGPPELAKVLKDVTGWKYGPTVHLESSLKVLKLWDIDNPPRLQEVEELDIEGKYGLRLRFQLAAVALERWQEKQDRLGRFFAKDLKAELHSESAEIVDLMLLPQSNKKE